MVKSQVIYSNKRWEVGESHDRLPPEMIEHINEKEKILKPNFSILLDLFTKSLNFFGQLKYPYDFL